MPGLIQWGDDDSPDDESEEDASVLEEFIIGGEDHTARLPGEPDEPPRGRARMDYMQRRQRYRNPISDFLLYWMEREWDMFQEQRSELEQQCHFINKTTNSTLEGADLLYLYSELIEHPHIVANRGNELVEMVIANAKRRNNSNNNHANAIFGQTERLLLDSASMIRTQHGTGEE